MLYMIMLHVQAVIVVHIRIVSSCNKPREILTIKSRLQSNTKQAISLLTCEMRVETSALNKIEEYTRENETCCKLGSELYHT